MRWRSHRISSNLNPRRWFANFWGAHAARVLVSASRRNNLLLHAIPVPLGAHDKSSRSRGRARQHASRVRSPANRLPLAFRSDPLMRTEVKRKPIACQFGDLLQCTRLLKQVRCAGNNLQLHFAAHLVARHFV